MDRLDELIEEGFAALLVGDSAAARRAFELALATVPVNGAIPLGPSASTRGWLGANSEAGRSSAAAIAWRDSRTSRREPEAVAITTRCPRSASSAETRETNELTSWRIAHGCGVTWAIVKRSDEATDAG